MHWKKDKLGWWDLWSSNNPSRLLFFIFRNDDKSWRIVSAAGQNVIIDMLLPAEDKYSEKEAKSFVEALYGLEET